MVFDMSGIHAINVDYCECPRDEALDRRTQLLRHKWFPVTSSRPNTVFTFDCLDTFHEHTLQGKGNLYDFYHLLVRKTDNTNVSDTIVCTNVCPWFHKLTNLSISIVIRKFIGFSEFGEISWP